MKTTTDAMKRHLKEKYDAACNAYLCELLNLWELDAHYGYWNSDRPGTIYHYGETHNLSMENIIYCVDNGIPEDEVLSGRTTCSTPPSSASISPTSTPGTTAAPAPRSPPSTASVPSSKTSPMR